MYRRAHTAALSPNLRQHELARFGRDEWAELGDANYPGPALEAEFSFGRLPRAVIDALRQGLEQLGVNLAIQSGARDENRLSNMIFFMRHRERNGRILVKGEPNFKNLSEEWLRIRDRLVRPALFKAFFAEYDRRSSPDPTLGVPANPRMSADEKRDRLIDVRAIIPVLLQRRDARAVVALSGRLPSEPALTGSLLAAARRLSAVQLALYREFFPDGAGGIRFAVFQRAFEQFANGELRDAASRNGVGEPDSGFYFLFAEFAFLCIASGIDSALWLKALRSFVKTQEIFIPVYRSARIAPPGGGPATRSLDSFSFRNFDPASQSSERRKAQLRAKYDRQNLAMLRRAARDNMLRAQRMP